ARDAERLWLDHHPIYGNVGHRYFVPRELYESVVPRLCRLGRCWLRAASPGVEVLPLTWDDGAPWVPSLGLRAAAKPGYYVATASFARGDERMELSAVRLLLAGGMLLTSERAARLDDGGAFAWIAHLREHGAVRVPMAQGPAFLEALLRLPRVP